LNLAEWRPKTAGPHEEVEIGMAAKISALPRNEREEAMLDFVRAVIRRVFNLSVRAEELGVRDRLSDLGMDSLIALELRSELAKGLGSGVQVSSTIAFDTGTIGELAKALLVSIAADSSDCQVSGVEAADENGKTEIAVSKPGATARAWKPRAMSVPVTAAQLSEMSEEEVEQLLHERLSRR
jgi:acyl carrier protein